MLPAVHFAQTDSHFLVDQDEEAIEQCLCEPGVIGKSKGAGVAIEYGVKTGQTWTVQEGDQLFQREFHVEQFKVKLKAPLVHKKQLKVLVGFEHKRQWYHFDDPQELQSVYLQSLTGKALKTNKVSLYAVKPINDIFYTAFRYRVAFRGDFEGLANVADGYLSQRISGIFGIKKRDDLEWGVGLNYADDGRGSSFLPFMFYNQTFTEKWGLESVLPVQIMGRYNFSPSRILLFGVKYSSSNHTLNVDNPLAFQSTATNSFYNVRDASINTTLILQQRVTPWVWMRAEAGYNFGHSARFEQIAGSSDYQVNPGNAMNFKIGLFLSPPDSFKDRH